MTRYLVHIQLGKRVVTAALIRQAVQATLAHQHAPAGTVNVQMADDTYLHELNRAFLGHDYATDVLSFPAGEVDPATGLQLFGDLALSWQRAQAQAAAGGHPVSAEVQLLVVHGTLHLLGFDHATPAQKRRMWRAQAEILSGLGCPITGPVIGQ